VVAWLDAQPEDSIWTTTVSVFEIRFGLNVLPNGKRKQNLQVLFETMIRRDFGGRVMDFDSPAAEQAARISAKSQSIGHPVEIRDVMIAGIVAAHGATFVTRNTKHFILTGIPLIDPWQSAS
jgi:predicted nucleic acid-binding protein